MRLTVLGGAAACPNPDQGCSSYLVESNGVHVLLDCGSDTLSPLRSVTDFRSIETIIISHLHSDHTLDLVPYRYGLKYAPGGSSREIPLWIPPGGKHFLHSLAEAFGTHAEEVESFFDVFTIREYDPKWSAEIGPFAIRFYRTRHFIPCWAIRLEVDGKSVVYLADTGPDEALIDFARDADLLICEGTHINPPPEPIGHLTARQAGEIAAAAGARKLLLTHLWAEVGFDHYRQEAESVFSPVVVAQPKLAIDV
ncbi:MAG TPA: MBL fold metallo-hydrolase [Nitrolancea sp.]|nr:MBL fold metallo-hydrolase [Nitrolancea sp.]